MEAIEKPLRVENTTVDDYYTKLVDKYRPPSKGGNTKAWHSHSLIIAGVRYGFLALGAKRWVYASDTVSFEYVVDGEYKNIKTETVVVKDKAGLAVVRGNRGAKPFRTAETRLPASRREQRD